MFEFRKRNSIEKFSMGATVEVDNQRNCLVMCVNSSGILIEIVTHMNILRVRVHYPYPYTDIGVS